MVVVVVAVGGRVSVATSRGVSSEERPQISLATTHLVVVVVGAKVTWSEIAISWEDRGAGLLARGAETTPDLCDLCSMEIYRNNHPYLATVSRSIATRGGATHAPTRRGGTLGPYPTHCCDTSPYHHAFFSRSQCLGNLDDSCRSAMEAKDQSSGLDTTSLVFGR